MNGKTHWREAFGQMASMAIAVLAVTAAAYLWRALGKWAVLVTYSVSLLLMFVGAWIIFRRIVRRDYKQNDRLTPLPFFLQILVWGLSFAFPCIYNPIDWAWLQSEISRAIPVLGNMGWTCVWIGLAVVIGAMFWLGMSRSFGQKGKHLESSGPYGVTRNPQLMGGALLIIGYILLWPSWYALGWLTLFTTMAHLMILAEEEYLLDVYGEEYTRYCQRVPRYLGLPKTDVKGEP